MDRLVSYLLFCCLRFFVQPGFFFSGIQSSHFLDEDRHLRLDDEASATLSELLEALQKVILAYVGCLTHFLQRVHHEGFRLVIVQISVSISIEFIPDLIDAGSNDIVYTFVDFAILCLQLGLLLLNSCLLHCVLFILALFLHLLPLVKQLMLRFWHLWVLFCCFNR